MRKILFITLITSFISLESQAEDKVCDVIGDDIREMFTGKTLGNCKAGNLMQVWTKDPSIAMDIMIKVCQDKTIQIFEYEDSAMLHASCRLMPVNKWRGRNSFKDI